jgi:alpha-beta hydrolase superfamily lysophospholipase
MRYLSNRGYCVIGFDGPGQGAALRKFGLPITYQWEKSVKSVLDYFHLDDVTIIGISMGGWFCLRAAAFESRITRVIATGYAIKSIGERTFSHRKSFFEKRTCR